MNAHVTDPRFRSDFAGASYADRQARPVSGLTERLTAAIAWLRAMPRRHAVLEELRSLSDHELADVGLSREDIGRVFDPAFAGARQARLRG